MKKQQKSHIGIGMAIGAAIGVASAVFLQSKEGKMFTKDLGKKTLALQKKVAAELEKGGDFTKERYQELVDTVVSHYATTKEIAQHEIPIVKKSLMSTWKTVEKQLKEAKNKFA